MQFDVVLLVYLGAGPAAATAFVLYNRILICAGHPHLHTPPRVVAVAILGDPSLLVAISPARLGSDIGGISEHVKADATSTGDL